MMKKLLFVALLFTASQVVFSQKIHVVSNVQVPIPEQGALPIISPTGDFLVLTGGDMKGLKKYDIATQKLSTITNDKGAGFKPKISRDGSKIVYRQTEYKNKLRYTTLKSIDIESGKETQLIKETRNLQGVDIVDGTVLAVDNGKLIKKKVSGARVAAKDIVPVASVNKGKLYVTANGKTKQVSPPGTGASYLWASVSPNGEKLLYYSINNNKVYVSDLDGSNPVDLGLMHAPNWLGNDWVVGMLDVDNGEVITASQIVAVATNGKGRTILTDSSVIAVNPSASTDAGKIAYNTNDGKVYLMSVITTK